MSYVVGEMTAVLHSDGRREVRVDNPRVVQGDKPRRLEDSGADVALWREKIRENVPGTYYTLTFVGGATALTVRRGAIALPDADFLAPMQANFGELGLEALLGAVRTGASAATQFCVDTCGGMFTSINWELETLISMLKILVFKSDGWVRLVLPPAFAAHQEAFDEAQRQRWAVARPGFEPQHEAGVSFLPLGQDRFNGEPALDVFGPDGDSQFIRVARLELEGEGFLFRDGEWRTGRRAINQRRPDMVQFQEETVPALFPLNRQIVATTTVANHPGVPLILQLHPDGHLHPGGLHVFADGLNHRLNSHNPRRVLGPYGLGWLK